MYRVRATFGDLRLIGTDARRGLSALELSQSGNSLGLPRFVSAPASRCRYHLQFGGTQ